jgi:hypothetical protein
MQCRFVLGVRSELTFLTILERLARGVYELSDHSISQKKEMIDAADTEVKNWVSL